MESNGNHRRESQSTNGRVEVIRFVNPDFALVAIAVINDGQNPSSFWSPGIGGKDWLNWEMGWRELRSFPGASGMVHPSNLLHEAGTVTMFTMG